MKDKPKLLVSFSSGETSAMMSAWIKDNLSQLYDIIYVMANTSEENEESLIFADKCDKYFGLNLVYVEAITNPTNGKGIKAKVVTFETADRTGRVFEESLAKHGIPNIKNPHCTRELKEYTIRAYCKSIGWKNYYIAIGYRADEIDRINIDWKKKRHIYPFITLQPTTKVGVNKYWVNMPFRLNLKGYEDNCKVCFKKSLRKLLTIAKHNPERFDNVIKWEIKYGSYIPETRKHNESIKLPIRFFRNNLSANQIIEMSKSYFDEAPDDRLKVVEFTQLDLFGYSLDESGGVCGDESCEPFN